MSCTLDDFRQLVVQLPGVNGHDHDRYWRYEVAGATFAYLWEPTRTVGLKQTIVEQLDLVAERPDVFEVQFTSGGFGWVVVHLAGIDADELAELLYEAWELSAPEVLAQEHPMRR